MSKYNRERLNSALLFPACAHSCLYYLINAQLRLYWERLTDYLRDSVSSSLFLRAKLHKLHIRHLCSTSNCALMAVMLNKVY